MYEENFEENNSEKEIEIEEIEAENLDQDAIERCLELEAQLKQHWQNI